MSDKRLFIHWPILVLGLVVAIIFFTILFVFEVPETTYAIVQRLGRPIRHTVEGEERVVIYSPGLHVKIPFIDQVWLHDKRLYCYDLKTGQTEQMQTADNYQVLLSTFVLWRVGDPYTFFKAVGSTADAESKLDEIVRNSRSSVIGMHTLDEMINVEADAIELDVIEGEMLDGVAGIAMNDYGIEVRHVGIKHIGFPEQVTQEVFERMRRERKRQADKILAEGEAEAQKIRAGADLKVRQILADAEAAATTIRAEGDTKAAEYYAAFRQHPELAEFLRKLDALRKTLGERTTLVLDTSTPPYDLFLPDAINLEKLARDVSPETDDTNRDDSE